MDNSEHIAVICVIFNCDKEEAEHFLNLPINHSYLFKSGKIYDARKLNNLIEL